MPSRTTIKIAEMLEKTNIEDENLMIVEDDIDTKRTTVKELKRAFNGDGIVPSSYKFYSSKQTQDLIDGIKIGMTNSPTKEEFDNLKQQVTNIQTSGGGSGEKDPELVAARGEYDTLSDRLDGDLKELEEKFIQFPTVEHYGMTVDLTDIDKADARITVPAYEKQTTVTITGKNKFSLIPAFDYTQIIKTATGIRIPFTKAQNAFNIRINDGNIVPGNYTFYGSISMSDDFIREGSVFKLIYTDGSTYTMDYKYQNKFNFDAKKNVKAFQILPNVNTIVDNMWVQIDDLMISTDDTLDEYVPYCDKTIIIEANTSKVLEEVIYKAYISRSDLILSVSAIDTSYTGDKIKDEIESLKEYTQQPEDYCGLLENKGIYVFAENATELNSPGMATIEVDKNKIRNHRPSVKITIMDYNEEDQPRFTLRLQDILNLTDARYISFQFYIDRDLSERFSEDDGIKIMLSSDSIVANPATNYFYFNIGKNSFVQGWNTIKLKLSDFLKHGAPNIGNITQINFRIFSSEFTNGKEFWFNSIIVDQRIKPTVLLAFDNLYDDAFDYQFPYLYTRGIPATLFFNDKQTLPRTYLNNVAELYYTYGWDIGNYGCNPNKELMIEDNNVREQYMAVKETRQWIYDNFTEDVIAYAAPFGNLRPISEPMLKRLGFKIAKATADAYCSFFSSEDFCIPMHLMSNADGCGADIINAKIDEIVETGQVLCIYTDNVTRYGDEISVTKVSFESIIAHIQKYLDQGTLQCLTFSEFYKQCTEK